MTNSNAVAAQTVLQGRVLDIRGLREARGGKTGDVSTAQAAFQRVGEKEELIDRLVRFMSQPSATRAAVADAKEKIANLRAEIQAEYDDLIAKLELQEALKKLDLY